MIVVRRDSRARQPFTADPPICAALTDDAKNQSPASRDRCSRFAALGPFVSRRRKARYAVDHPEGARVARVLDRSWRGAGPARSGCRSAVARRGPRPGSHQLSNAAYTFAALSPVQRGGGQPSPCHANQRYHLKSGLFRVDVDAFDAHVHPCVEAPGYEASLSTRRPLAINAGDFMGDEASSGGGLPARLP